MQIYGIFTENRGKYAENRGKYVENQGISEEFIPQPLAGCPVFAVVSGRFCSHFRRKSENFGEKWRISETSFRFYSFLFLFVPQPLDFLPQMLNLTIHNKKVIFLFGRT